MLGDTFEAKALLAVIAAVLGATLTWLSTVYFQTRKDRSEQRRMLAVLFGELLNILQHYRFSSVELPSKFKSENDRLTAKFVKYGPLVFSGKEIAHIGFLSNQDIMDFMQLSLVIRNTDMAVDSILMGNSEDNVDNLSRIRERMMYAIDLSQSLISEIGKRNENLKTLTPR